MDTGLAQCHSVITNRGIKNVSPDELEPAWVEGSHPLAAPFFDPGAIPQTRLWKHIAEVDHGCLGDLDPPHWPEECP